MSKFCLDCGKKITKRAKRCQSCAPKLRPNYIGGVSVTSKYCVDCNKELSYYQADRCKPCSIKHRTKRRTNYCIDCQTEIGLNAKRCKPCANKERCKDPKNCSNYIDGRSLKENHCVDCGKKIDWRATKCRSCARKGKNHHFYGKKFTTEHKLKLSERLKGRKHSKESIEKMRQSQMGHKGYFLGKKFSLEHRDKIGLSHQGEKHWNWRGGISFKPYDTKFTDSLRRYIRKRDSYICQRCGLEEREHLDKYGKKLAVHHIDYDKERSISSNLITLCHKCNSAVNTNRKHWRSHFEKIITLDYVLKNIECRW